MANEPNNDQYGKPLFGFEGDYTSTGAPGTSSPDGTPPATLQHGQLGTGIPGHDLTHAEVTHTGAPGSAGQTPRPDGGSATVTDAGHSGIPEHGTKTGTTNTNKESMTGLVNNPGGFGPVEHPVTKSKGTSGDAGVDTGAGHGTAKTERP